MKFIQNYTIKFFTIILIVLAAKRLIVYDIFAFVDVRLVCG